MKQGVHKAPGGIIRVEMEVKDGIIKAVSITGDFFWSPEDTLEELEARLKDVPAEPPEILKKVTAFYEEKAVESPGVGPGDIVEAIQKAF